MNLEDSMSKVKIKGKSTYTIYGINVLNKVYIGKTNNFERRRSEHINRCHNKNDIRYNIPLYKHIRKLEEKGEFKFDESHFEIIEEITDYEDEEYILHMERAWVEFYRDEMKIEMMNVFKPILTEKERKEQHNKKTKKYYQANKEEINRQTRENKKKKRANENPQQREERLKKERENAKKYREANKDEINRKKRERRAKKKETERQAQNNS